METRLATFVFLLGTLLLLDTNTAGQRQVKYVQVVKQAPTSVSLFDSTATVDVGQAVQFKANVAPTHPSIPTGSVVFAARGTEPGNTVTSPAIPLDASGSADWVGRYPSPGSYVVFATYGGDLNYLASESNAIPLTVVGAPDFQIHAPDAVTIHRGDAWRGSIIVESLNGFTGSVSLKCGNLPVDILCSFSPSTVVFMPQTIPPGASTPEIVNANAAITIRTFPRIIAAVGLVALLAWLPGLARKRKARIGMCAVSSIILCFFLAGCGSYIHFTRPDGTAFGTYRIVISGTSRTLIHDRVITVKVVK